MIYPFPRKFQDLHRSIFVRRDRQFFVGATLAHPCLPSGSRARVTNLRNGKTVEVTINDRGLHGGGRIIDLSRAAAKRLDMSGTARVSIVALP